MKKRYGLVALVITSLLIDTPISILAKTSNKADNIKQAVNFKGVQSSAMMQDGKVSVTKQNFLNYFNLNGSAVYDKSTGIVTLTPDQKSKSGNMTLKNKINSNQDFSLQGQINIGNKSQENGGADGMGIGFHGGDTTAVGQSGGAMGIGGLAGGFGWKADTFWNSETDQKDEWYHTDPKEFGGKNLEVGKGHAFGAFMYNDGNRYVTAYDGSDAPAQKFDEPENNQFKNISVDYSGNTHVMEVNYDGKTWTKNISQFNSSKALAFMISAATGDENNLQQFKINSFDYTAYGVANTRFVDLSTGKQIYTGKQYSGDLGQSVSMDKDVQDTIKVLNKKGYNYNSVTATDKDNFNAKSNEVTMTKELNTITYYFERQKGDLTAHYIDEASNKKIHDDIQQTGRVDDPFSTQALAISGYALDTEKMPQNSTGYFKVDHQDIYYYYKKVNDNKIENGTVTTRFVDEATNQSIADQVEQTGRVDDPYTTNAIGIKNYALDTEKLPENAKGKFVKGNQVVTYYYKKVNDNKVENGTVTTRFIDEATNQSIADQVEQTGRVDAPYTTNAIDIKDYALDTEKLPKNAKGKFITGNQVVTYYYKKVNNNKVENGTVTTRFVDEATNQSIADQVEQTGRVDDPYTTNAIGIKDYVLDTEKLPENAKGKFIKGNQVVTYYYKKVTDNKVENGTVITRFVDEATNQSIADQVEQTGRVDDPYTTNAIGIKDYALDTKKLPENAKGKFIKGNQVVTYYYKQVHNDLVESGKIVERFFDEDTNKEIAKRITQSGRINDAYQTDPIAIDGYKLDNQKLPNNQDGKFTKNIQNVDYYYNKDSKETPKRNIPEKPNKPAIPEIPVTPSSKISKTNDKTKNNFSNYNTSKSTNNVTSGESTNSKSDLIREPQKSVKHPSNNRHASLPQMGESALTTILMSIVGGVILVGLIVSIMRRKNNK